MLLCVVMNPFALFDRVKSGILSATTSATSIGIDEERGDAGTTDATTYRAGKVS